MVVTRRGLLGACSLAAASALAGCAALGAGPSGAPVGSERPIVFYNRRPTGAGSDDPDLAALGFNEATWYVGPDPDQGGMAQGEMVLGYVRAHAAELDRDGDGMIGYVLAIGDLDSPDARARTRGVRRALGTGVDRGGEVVADAADDNADGSSEVVRDATIEVDGRTYTIRELASREMRGEGGRAWDASAAGEAMVAWGEGLADAIDLVVANDDGMGMAMFAAWSRDAGVATFGFDATDAALDALADGYAGTVSQNAAVQAYLTLRLLRNAFDGVDALTGIAERDEAGNMLAEDAFDYSEQDRAYYVRCVAVTAADHALTAAANEPLEGALGQLDEREHPEMRAWVSVYGPSDAFLSSSLLPLIERYDELLNIKADYACADGASDDDALALLDDPSFYDAFAINLADTEDASSFLCLIR